MPLVEGFSVLTVDDIVYPGQNEKYKELAQGLYGLKRYDGIFTPQRTDVLTHTFRVIHLAQDLGHVLKVRNGFQTLNMDRVNEIASTHDHTEIKTGEHPFTVKLNMSPREQSALEGAERLAVVNLYYDFYRHLSPDRSLEDYRQLDAETREKKTIESQVVKMADIWDALCGKYLQIFCGHEGDHFIDEMRYSRRAFDKNRHFTVWSLLAGHSEVQLEKIPSTEELLELPRLTKQEVDDALNGTGSLTSILTEGQILKWPRSFQKWAQLSNSCFQIYAPEFMFPGWYPGLGNKLGLTVPSVAATA